MANEQRVARVDDDEILHANQSDVLLAAGENDIVRGVLGGQRAVGGVASLVGGQVLGHRNPASDVVPIKPRLKLEHAGGFLHDGVVDGYLGEPGKFRFEQGRRIVCRAQAGNEGGQLGRVLGQFSHDGGDRPDEHAGIPTKVALFEE